MTQDLPKTYDPSAVESEAYRVWTDEHCFRAEASNPGDPYSIVIPPPNVTGALHLGHAINNTLQDILTRVHRMRGFNTVWIPGLDHAGIATQAVVEKQLKEKENLTRHEVGREGLVERIWAWKQQYGDRIIEQLKRLGASCDWSRTRFTLDEMCARAVRETFFKLFKDGLIYRGKRLVNWDAHLQTSISDDEIYHETVKTNLWHIRYPIVDDKGGMGASPMRSGEEHGRGAHATSRPTHMIVATTRPETLLGDTAVAVHSEDPRWNWAIGKSVELPLTGRKIPIIADDILVDPKFGSGVVKVTPAHDPNDYAVYQRHLGKSDEIDILNILTPDGRINENGGAYSGMTRAASRKKVEEDLERQGLLAKVEPYETQVGHSDRSKTPIEPYLSDQWFVKMAPLAEPALEVVRNGTIRFFPERHAQQYLSWLGEKRDWPVSRQLWWGHRIPVWSRRGTTGIAYLQLLQQSPEEKDGSKYPLATEPIKFSWKMSARLAGTIGLLGCYETQQIESVDEANGVVHLVNYVCSPVLAESQEQELTSVLKDHGFTQDPDVLDTWFSSALWPHSTLGWPDDTPDLKKWYPTSVLLTGRDIITLWVARMVMTGLYNMHEIPFAHVAINPTILDGKGERMSKSKGNGVDPVEIIESHGADALRFTLTSMATETQDVRMPVKKLPNGKNTSEKFDLGRNFCNKLWNAARFALASLAVGATLASPSSAADGNRATQASPLPDEPVDETKWSLADRWIVSRFNRTVVECDEAMKVYRFDQYAKACYDFFWRDFCDWYVEAIKPTLKDPGRAGQTAHVLASVLDGALRLMHPMIPFITETIWWKLNDVRPTRGLPKRIELPPSARLIKAKWPTPGQFSEAAEFLFPKIQEIVVAIRNVRNEHKVDVKRSVAVSILATGDSARQITENKGVIELLATCELKAVGPDVKPIPSAARATAAGCEILIEGTVDEGAEKERSSRKRDELTRTVAALRGRLANESYVAKAPPHLVKQTQDQLAEAEAELAKLG